jgi:hypothetical protein
MAQSGNATRAAGMSAIGGNVLQNYFECPAAQH